jgi:hypothetical protein
MLTLGVEETCGRYSKRVSANTRKSELTEIQSRIIEADKVRTLGSSESKQRQGSTSSLDDSSDKGPHSDCQSEPLRTVR